MYSISPLKFNEYKPNLSLSRYLPHIVSQKILCLILINTFENFNITIFPQKGGKDLERTAMTTSNHDIRIKGRLSYNALVRQGIDFRRVGLLLLKWPLYAFKLLRKGRFATIAALRSDGYYLKTAMDSSRRLTRSDSDNFIKGLRTTMGSAGTAIGWAVFLALILAAERILPELHTTISNLLFGTSVVAILVGLSAIVQESNSTTPYKPGDSYTNVVSNILGGVFFIVSTLPFSLPWVLAFFFPRQCLLFFTAWAVFGAIINEVSVLVSHVRMTQARSRRKKDDGDDTKLGDPEPTKTVEITPSSPQVRPEPPRPRRRKTTEQQIATVSNFTAEDRLDLEDFILSEEGLKWWAAFLVMQATISAMAVFLRLFVDTYFTNPAIVFFALIMSMCMLCEALWMTYAVGGRWLHFRRRWRFFQPLAGGQRFAAVQVVAWTLFFSFLLASLADLRAPSRFVFETYPSNVPDWMKRLMNDSVLAWFERAAETIGLSQLPRGSVALCGVVAELLMLISLPLYKDDNILNGVTDNHEVVVKTIPLTKGEQLLKSQEKVAELYPKNDKVPSPNSNFPMPLWELAADIFRTIWLSPLVLTIVKPEVVLFLFGFILAKFVHRASFFGLFNIHLPYLIVMLQLAYLPTYIGDPRRTGRRRWWNLRGTWVFDELAAYWYVKIIREQKLLAGEKHIFGYHPHGLFPMGASYIHNTAQWIRLFPDITPYTLSATITHIVPMLRDVTQFNGGLEVTRASFANALINFGDVLLVPGGQGETFLESDDPYENLLSAKHKGFVRLALQSAMDNPTEQIKLVPIYAFGESDMLYNAFPASLSLQRWFASKFRLNPAFLPVGRFNLAGVPRRVPITFAVGSAVPVPVIKHGSEPTEAQIDLLASRYYSAVEETFERHKSICEGFENDYVSFRPPLPERLTKEEFEQKWEELVQKEQQSAIANDNSDKLIKPKQEDPIPIPEYAVAILVTNLSLWLPYLIFTT